MEGKRIFTIPVACLTACALPVLLCACSLNLGMPPGYEDDVSEDPDADGLDAQVDQVDDDLTDGQEDVAADDADDGVDAEPDETADIPEDEQAEVAVCGNSETESAEECDDGKNGDDDDGCTDDCGFSCHENPDCEDSEACTDDFCRMGGNGRLCEHELPDDCCFIDGAYYEDGDLNPANDCRGCDAETDQDGWTNLPPDSPCEDGYGCTTDDGCDGEGGCAFISPDDESCEAGEACLPLCFDNPSGCGSPPETLLLDCGSPVELPSTSTCALTLDSLAGQAACLSCEARAGWTLVDFSDFGDDGGACDLDGWELIEGDVCGTSYTLDPCAEAGALATCCAQLDTLCTDLDENFVLASDLETNCGGDVEEWRIKKSFNTTGLTDLELCLGIGMSGANNNDFLIIRIEDSGHGEDLVCENGVGVGALIGGIARDTLFGACMTLPAWAGNNAALTITIIANSNDSGDIFYIDDIRLAGWGGGCEPAIETVFEEPFGSVETCDAPITDGWRGWRVTGEPQCPGIQCPGGAGDQWGAQARNSSWSMEHDVDASALDGKVEICFDVGEHGANANESVHVEFSSDGGTGWLTAWYHERDMGTDDVCRRICVNLSMIDPNVRRNPDLVIRVTLTADDKEITIDDITVSGAVFCDPGAAVTAGPVSETGTPGLYGLTVRSTGRLSSLVACSWNDEDPPVSGFDEILFTPAP
ncbi:MAG: hypothetical protein ABIJ56_17925 [Pseudomonadota bacterium]